MRAMAVRLRRSLPNLHFPGAVLGVVDDLDPRVLVAEYQDGLAFVLASPWLAPLALEQLERRVASLGVRPVRDRELQLAHRAAAAGGQRDPGGGALPLGRQ